MIPFIHVMSAYSMPGTISAIRSKIVDKTEKKKSAFTCVSVLIVLILISRQIMLYKKDFLYSQDHP